MSEEDSKLSTPQNIEEAGAIWSCEIPTLQKDVPWTVGAKHTLSCRGDFNTQLKSPIKIVVIPPPEVKKNDPANSNDPNMQAPTQTEKQDDPNKDYALKILETKNIDSDSADFIVTSYKAAQHSNVEIKLVGSEGNEIAIEPMTWTVASVVTKQNEKGFGPTSPMLLKLPWMYWAMVIGVIVFVALLFVGKLLLLSKWRKQVKEMKSFSTALGPTNQFYKDMRTLSSLNDNFPAGELSQEAIKKAWDELSHKFNLYLIRQFEVPALKWKITKLVPAIRKKLGSKWNIKLHTRLKRILDEFKKGSSVEKLRPEDLKQMQKLCQGYVELIKGLNLPKEAK